MGNIKDKLIEVIRASGYGYFITQKDVDVEDCLKATADSIIENLPELLADNEWVRLPFGINEEVYCIERDMFQYLQNTADEQPNSLYKIHKGIVCNYILNDIYHKIYIKTNKGCSTLPYGINSNWIFRTRAEAETKLAEIEGIKKNVSIDSCKKNKKS